MIEWLFYRIDLCGGRVHVYPSAIATGFILGTALERLLRWVL